VYPRNRRRSIKIMRDFARRQFIETTVYKEESTGMVPESQKRRMRWWSGVKMEGFC